MRFRALRKQEFIKKFEKLPPQVQEEIKILRDKILEYPYIGDPLGYAFLREKKLKGLRIYFIIYEEDGIVLFVDISSKRNQQEVIDRIKKRVHEYREYVNSISQILQSLLNPVFSLSAPFQPWTFLCTV